MTTSKLRLICAGLVPLLLIGTGCATKGFVKTQIADTNAKISALEAKTNEQATKEQADITAVDQKIAATDSKVADVSASAQQANTTANQANQLAQQNQAAIAANNAATTAAINNLNSALSYSLLAKADVTFGFNKSTLGKTDQAALDTLVQQFQTRPRAVVDIFGYADRIGASDYNLSLSRRRAETVARYLVSQGIPLQGIHIIGMGEEHVPPNLLAELQTMDPNITPGDARRLARRVLIRVYVAQASLQTSASAQN
ncbi:MAG: OmpA family protein [Acidobacteriaceae bacterium]|nr:OmpA family protein [Acidobacteriaceae bacterium]